MADIVLSMKLTVIEEYEPQSSDEAQVVIAKDIEDRLFAREGGQDSPFFAISEYTIKRNHREVTGIEYSTQPPSLSGNVGA